MSIDPKSIELTADVLKIFLENILRVRTIASMLSEAVLASASAYGKAGFLV